MNSKTIVCVPLDRLEDAARAARIAGYTGLAEELRALLDTPAEEQQWVSVEAFNRVSTELEERKATQPQGEPVAWQYRVSAGPQTGWSLWAPGKGEEYAEHYTVETRPLYAEQPAPVDDGTTSDKYRAELYDEVWQKARALGFSNATDALSVLAGVSEPYAYEYEFATVIYKDGPGKFKKVITNEAPDQHAIDSGSIINVKPLYALGRQKYDDTLLPFLAMMRKELHANSYKGDREGWLGIDRETAMAEVHWHVKKLGVATEAADLERITEHAADVANMAMMLLDVCHGLPRNN